MLRVEIVAILETIFGKTFYAIPLQYSKEAEDILEYIDDKNTVYNFRLYNYGGKGTSGEDSDFLKVYPVIDEPDIEDWAKTNSQAVEVEVYLCELKGLPREKKVRWFCDAIVK